METTCPHCTQPLELDAETLDALTGATEFQCPICTGPVPMPVLSSEPVAAPENEAIQIQCPSCLTALEIDPETLHALQATSHFDCPTCRNPVPVPESKGEPPAEPTLLAKTPPAPKPGLFTTIARTLRQSNRNLVILGVAALLLLGGLGIFLALRKGPATTKLKREVNIDVTNNKFFQDLVAAGPTTTADLQQIVNIQPMGVTFIGASREKLTWEQAEALAKKTGSHILTIEPIGQASRQPVLDAIAAAYPDLLGTTTWAMENGEPRVIDGPDVNRVTTLDRPRVALFNWYPKRDPYDPNRNWIKFVSTSVPLPHTFIATKLDSSWLYANYKYNNAGDHPVNIWVYGFSKGQIARSDIGSASGSYAKGAGEAKQGFAFWHPGLIDEIRIQMVDEVTKEILATAMVPAVAEWLPDKENIDIEIISVRPPATLSPTKELTIPAKAGEKFTLNVTARYKAPEPTKLASNLLMKDANILPSEFLAELSANHSATWHFDTESRPGYTSVNGAGEITFDLTAYAPRQPGKYTFTSNIGLFDKQTWATKVLKLYPTTIVATDRAPVVANPSTR